MSSSDPRPYSLFDLHGNLPAVPEPDFVDGSDFTAVESQHSAEPTPDEAYRNGLVEGEQRGRDAALKELQPAINELQALTISLAQVRKTRFDEAETELTRAAIEIAQRIVHGELQQTNDIVVRLAKSCIDEAKDDGPLTLHVNPADLELIRTHMAELESELAEGDLRLQSDTGIHSGAVVLQTPTRCYDGRADRLLEALDVNSFSVVPEAEVAS